MRENERLNGYFEIMGQTLRNKGVPLSVYSDQHTIFRSPKTEERKEAGEEANLTQFGRALEGDRDRTHTRAFTASQGVPNRSL